MPLLAELFPEALFIHVVRDGRDVALALRDTPFGPSDPVGAARHWAGAVSAARHHGAVLGNRYIEVRYEDLVDDAERELQRVCDAVGLPFTSAMLDHRRSAERWLKMSAYPEHHSRLALPPVRRLRDWRKAMGREDAAVFQLLAGEALGMYGYEPYDGEIPLRSRFVAVRSKAWAKATDMARRLGLAES